MSDANPRPDPAPVVKMFAALEVRRLAELIEAGDLSELGDGRGELHANVVAASWSAPPLTPRYRRGAASRGRAVLRGLGAPGASRRRARLPRDRRRALPA